MVKKLTIRLMIVLGVCGLAFSEPLSSTEIDSIIEQLCQVPVRGWIQEGTIEALHQAFNAATGETTETDESVTTDGNRFLWHIRVRSIDVSEPSNPGKTKDFMEQNKDRLFVWDGQNYTLYFKSGNQAITYESPDIPVHVNGPLTAGIIPWGNGIYTPDSFNAAQISAVRTQTNEGLRIEMAIRFENRPEIQMVLDPDKAYAVLSCTLVRSPSLRTVRTYGNFTLQGQRWIPMTILIEQFDNDRFTSSDMWEITALRNEAVGPEVFKASFQEKTLVEYHTPALDKPAFYRYSNRADTESLLNERLVAGLKKGVQKQNCATVAVRHILDKLEVTETDQELISLVNDGSNNTSLHAIQQFVQKKGLSCIPVKTEIQALSKLKDCEVLLHFPKKKHFVVLDRVEGQNIWLIDLDRQTFYRTMTVDEFKHEWAGIALVVSAQTPVPGLDYKPVPVSVLKKIKGSADYSCSKLIQEYHVILCPEMVLGTCGGRYYMYYDRYACELDSNGGFCKGIEFVGHVYSPCVEDWEYPGTCDDSGDWRIFKMRACQP